MKNLFNLVCSVLFIALLAITTLPAYGPAVSFSIFLLFIVLLFTPITKGVAGMNNTNNMSARESFNIAKNILYNAMRDKFPAGVNGDNQCRAWVNSRKLSQSEIRSEVVLTTTASQFVFGITTQQASTGGNAPFNTERRLNLQDSLIASEYAIYVGQPSSSTDTTWQLHTYGNHVDFAAATANALNSCFYSHGYFGVNCNNDVLVPYRGVWNHYYVPQTQDGVGITAQTVFPEDQQRGSDDGLITLEPNLLLIGSKNYVPSIILPAALAAATANQRAVLVFKGILAQNSTVVS